MHQDRLLVSSQVRRGKDETQVNMEVDNSLFAEEDRHPKGNCPLKKISLGEEQDCNEGGSRSVRAPKRLAPLRF